MASAAEGGGAGGAGDQERMKLDTRLLMKAPTLIALTAVGAYRAWCFSMPIVLFNVDARLPE